MASKASRVPSTPTRKGELDSKLADHVFEDLKREIVENRVRAEQILTEATLAEHYDVSRVPVREALQRLSRTGFVRAVARVGYIVATVSVRDFDEIFQMRFVLEPLAAELATDRLNEHDERRLRELAAQSATIIDSTAATRSTQIASTNAAFHREVARLAGSRRLERTVGELIDELERVMHMLAHDPSLVSVRDEHSRLVETMRSGDRAAAGRMMSEQLHHDYEVMRPLAIRGDAGVLETRTA